MKKTGRFLKYLFSFLAILAAALMIYFYGYDRGAHDLFVDEELMDEDTSITEASVWDHRITWFEIPVEDIDRAKQFYEQLLDTALLVHADSLNNTKMVFLPPQSNGIVSGSLVKGEDFRPSENGVLVFINCNPDLDEHLKRAIEAGATVIQPKTLIAEEIGYMAIIRDSEGNKIAMHSSR